MRAAPRAEVVRAAPRVAAPARRARVAARRAPRDHDPVALRDRRHAGPELLDDSRAFVAEEDGKPHPPAARLDHVQVGVAEAVRDDADANLVLAGRVERHLLERDAVVREDDASHAARRSCSSSGTSGSWNVSTALASRTTLSPSASIVSWSRVTGAPGRRSVSRRLRAHHAERHVDRRPPHAERALQPLPELVPRHRVRPAELERAGDRLRDGVRVVLREILDPDRLELLRPRPDDRRDRREAREADEGREDAAVAPEDEARPEDHVVEAGLLHRALHLPLRRVVRHRVLRRLVEAERAREDEAADAGVLRSGDEIARALRHDALEVRRRALDDRDEVDDRVHSLARVAQRGRVVDVAGRELDAPGGEPRRA